MARINRDDVDKFHDYSIYIPTRTLFIGSHDFDEGDESGTDGQMAERLIKNIAILSEMPGDNIVIIMNNPGGDVIHGMAIYDAIAACPKHVTIKVFGHAMSMGSIILQAADERILAPNSRFMIHYGSFGVNAVAKTAYNWAEENKKFDGWMENMYLGKIHEKLPAFKLNKLQKMLDFDTILTPEETIALGLADKVLVREDKE